MLGNVMLDTSRAVKQLKTNILMPVLFFMVLLLPFYTVRAGEPASQQLKQMVEQLQKTPDDNVISEKIIKLAQEVKPAPAAQEEKNDIEGFVFVKGGCFEMGDTFGDGGMNEKPAHNVCVDDFYMGKYEVTQRQWAEVMESNRSYFKGCEDCPADRVNWIDAQEFILTFNRKTGSNYRLPTEAEWEYAARSGGKREKWAGTSYEEELGDYAWYDANSGQRTHPVGQKKPNGLGLYDMSGNVWEWVQDWYDVGYYKSSSINNPQGPSRGQERVLHGGSWFFKPGVLRASVREWLVPNARADDIGFRLAISSSHQ